MSETNKHNKVPDHIKILDKILSSKGELRSFVTMYILFSARIYVVVITFG
jgi:hypothetical protein